MRVRFCASFVELNLTSRSGSRYGRGRRKTELTTLKNPTFAADFEREAEDGDQREAGRLEQLADGERTSGMRPP